MQTSSQKLYQSSVAMTVALVSWGMMFATLFLGYFLLRFNSASWPPVEIQTLPRLTPFLSTMLMLLSSASYMWYEKAALTEKNEKNAKLGLFITVVLGFGFLVNQWFMWQALHDSGVLVENGMISSMMYAFTWLHAAHMVLAVLGLVWLLPMTFKGVEHFSSLMIINIGKFWHFLGVVWILMYLLLFVI